MQREQAAIAAVTAGSDLRVAFEGIRSDYASEEPRTGSKDSRS